MRRIQRSLQAIIATVLLTGLPVWQPGTVWANQANDPSLIISQLKITSSNGQFITLYNATDSALDMGKYRLEYFNSYDLGKATSGKLITLSGTVPPHGYFMVNDDTLLLCYQLTVDSVSLGLSSTAGRVEVLAFDGSDSNGSAAPILQDYVSWSKKDADGAQTLPEDTDTFLQRQPVDADDNPLVKSPGDGSWQSVRPDGSDPCNLVAAGSSAEDAAPVPTGLDQLLPPGEPPATILQTDSSVPSSPLPTMPVTDIGLKAPAITELLPNPAGAGNDSTDEFIELYNPNSKAFDLSGFSLQTGTTSLHTFTFPSGTSLPPKSFKAFYSSVTGLSLSNSGSQAKLLDPFGNSISASAVYKTAKDGIAWALARGKWYWTTTVTPGKANIIKEPVPKKTKKSSKSTSKRKTTKSSATKIGTANTASSDTADPAANNPIHVRTLVLVAALALLYALYEYRADLANRIYRFRQNFGARYEDRT